LENNPASTNILILDEFLGMFIFFLGRLKKKLGESVQGHIITIIIGSLQKREKQKTLSLKT